MEGRGREERERKGMGVHPSKFMRKSTPLVVLMHYLYSLYKLTHQQQSLTVGDLILNLGILGLTFRNPVNVQFEQISPFCVITMDHT